MSKYCLIGIDKKTWIAEILATLEDYNIEEICRHDYIAVVADREKAKECWGKVIDLRKFDTGI